MPVAYCPRCGTGVPEDSVFCHTCGEDLRARAPLGTTVASSVDHLEIDVVRDALGGEYEILKEIGRGGMGIVFKVRELALDRVLALKVLPFQQAFDAGLVDRFQREARTAARLSHPNIVTIHRVGQAGRVIYFTMKYVDGPSLGWHLDQAGRIEPDELRGVLHDTASALAYAHKHGVVHRDIKPDNILFDDHGSAQVLDFGIATAGVNNRLTVTGAVVGTPQYMSPEQISGVPLDGRSDIYSLGVVAYQCLTGHLPFDGPSAISVMYGHVNTPLPEPVLETTEQREVFHVIAAMLAKTPGQRLQTADAIIDRLPGPRKALTRRPRRQSRAEAMTMEPAQHTGMVAPSGLPQQSPPRAMTIMLQKGTRVVNVLTGRVLDAATGQQAQMLTNKEIFLCHCHEDREFVLDLAKTLKERGIPVWVDRWDIAPGQDWDRSVEKALERCTHMLVVLSPHVEESEEVRAEFLAALREGKVVVPVLLRASRIHRRLAQLQHVSYVDRPADDEEALVEIVRALGLTEYL